MSEAEGFATNGLLIEGYVNAIKLRIFVGWISVSVSTKYPAAHGGCALLIHPTLRLNLTALGVGEFE